MISAMLSVSLLAIAPVAAGCDYPKKIDVPNGLITTKEEMLTGQRDVKQFVSSMEEYMDCIVAEEKLARSQLDDIEPEDEQLREDMLSKKYNAAVDDMERVAAEFNTAVQTYRSRDE